MDDPEQARRALAGVRVYQASARTAPRERRVHASVGRARLIGERRGRVPVVLVPSLINAARILDLMEGRSLVDFLDAAGFDVLLVDWGSPEMEDHAQSIDDHVRDLLLPLIDAVGEPAHVAGYCLGGTMALAAACLRPVRSLTMIAAPWHFARYPADSREAITQFWQARAATVEALGAMPMAMLQEMFWRLDPERTVAKFAALADRDPGDATVTAFAAVEDWANGGAPLTHAAARQLFDAMMIADQPGSGGWTIDGRTITPDAMTAPALQLIAHADRIVPAATAIEAMPAHRCASGHVGMVIGQRAEGDTWAALAAHLTRADAR